jgi:TRAP transporter 4TM/12TM fusion protein
MFDIWKKRIIFAIGICMAFFCLYASLTQAFEAFLYRTLFLGFCMVLVFLTRPALRSRPCVSFFFIDFPLIILSLIPVVYAVHEHYDLLLRVGEATQWDFILGIIFILLVLEATRRAVGWPILTLAIILMIYTFYGPYFPSSIAHGGYTVREFVELNYMGVDGILGIMIGVTADFIFVFIIFGAFLQECGAIKKFTDIAQSLMGWQVGGAAKTAVIASGMMGSLSGSSAANVVTTGSFTIPMMKRLGYRPTFAGAVEAAASTGGQIMPPIMGASAFVIMAVLGTSYLSVCKAALVPACFYFLSVGICVHYTSKKMGLKGLPKKELPPILQSLVRGGLLLTPVVVIIGMLLKGYTPISAGFYAVITLLIVSFVQKDTRLNVKKFFLALSTGSLNILSIAIVCACAGIIVSCFLITGLGMRMSSIIGTIAASSVYLALIVAAIACIILGMGMPTVGAYIIVATLGAPALIQLGFSEMGTHLFAFFYAILCNVTPPVALAAYAATPIAGEGTNPWNIGWKAFSFTLASFILPFIFIRNSALILDGSFLQIIYSLIVVFVAILSLNVAIVGYRYRGLSIVERALFVIASALLFQAATRISSSTLSLLDFLTNIGGLCLFVGLTIFQRKEVIYQIIRSHLPFWQGKAVRGSSHSAEGEAAGERQ